MEDKRKPEDQKPFKNPNIPLKNGQKNIFRGVFFYLILVVLSLFIFFNFSNLTSQKRDETPITQVAQDIKDGAVDRIEVQETELTVFYKNGKEMASHIESNGNLISTLKDLGVAPEAIKIDVLPASTSGFWINLAGTVIPMVLIVLFFVLMFRQAQSAGGSLFSFGKSRAKLFTKDMPQIKFEDAAGVEEAKNELREVVEFLKHPQKFRALGAKIPKGVLLVGPPGTGKTLLARAVAGEAGVPFYSIAGSEFMEMLVGVGASRVRDLFEEAKKTSPSIIFIDELDAIGRQRGAGLGGGHDEREQTLNQILVEMDGFDNKTNVIVVSATNRPDILDPALLRPGRFDRHVVLDLPDLEGRKGIIKIHMEGKPVSPDADIDKIARRTVGFSGADIENMLNEAAILAARQDKKVIDPIDIEEAATKVKLGPEKKRLQSDEERQMTAYHEAGHAVVTYYLPHLDPVHRISIVSRGLALGYTMIPPATDRYNETRTRLIETITSMLGGRVAEELKFKELTVGASSDIERATSIARDMVMRFGMSKLGPIALGKREELVFLGRDFSEQKTYSEDVAAKIDEEIEQIITSAYKEAKKVLEGHTDKLDIVASELIKKETIEGDEFDAIMKIKSSS